MPETHAVLVVDGDNSARKATVRVLGAAGYPVLQAADGKSALCQARASRPALVLLDVGLPDMSGTEVLRRIRADPTLETVSVVLISGRPAEPDQQAEGLDSGADGYIVRPIPSAELLARVRAQLRQRARIDGYRASEARIRNLIERQVDAVLVVDRSGMITYANTAAGVLFGRSPSELDGAPFGFPIVSGANPEAQVLDIARRGRTAAVAEMRVTQIDWEGQPACIATLRDITARRAAELGARESKALLDMATNVARLGAWSLDVATRATVWSDSMRDILDVEPGVTLPFSEIAALVATDHGALIRDSFDSCLRDGTSFDIEVEATTRKSRRIHMRCLGEAVRDDSNRIVRLQGAVQDVTDLKLAEQSVAKSERRFRELTEAMPMIVWTAAPDGTVDYINRQFFQYTALSSKVPPEDCWQQSLPPEDLQRLLPIWAESLQTGGSLETEFRIRRGCDQTDRWHLARAVAIRDDTDAIVKWYGTAMDIHAARLLQEEADRLTERLTWARDQAEHANRAKSRFLAGMSHELRTPLSGILGYAQLLHMEGGLNAPQSARVHAMLDAGKHLLEMINCVLDLSQIEANRVELHPCAVDPRNIALACLDFVRPAAEAKGLALRLSDGRALPGHVMVDPTRFRQVVLNLLGNAVKFATQGSVELRLLTTTDGEGLRVGVADTGPGIPAALHGQLFQDFERLGTDAPEGAGLGLALSARLVALMEGQLNYEPNPTGGSLFWLDLPSVVIKDDLQIEATPDSKAQPFRPLHLLVVDDVAMNREIAGAFLRAAGHTVGYAGSGAEAVEAATSSDYDAILMDVRMPGMDGLEAARAAFGLWRISEDTCRSLRSPHRHSPSRFRNAAVRVWTATLPSPSRRKRYATLLPASWAKAQRWAQIDRLLARRHSQRPHRQSEHR